MRLAIDWTKHIKDPQGKADYEKAIRNSTLALSRLKDICKERINNNIAGQSSLSSYDNPNWGLVQADSVGYRRAMNEIDQLLSFLEPNKGA